ncbi:MAG TPA: Hpt domain-containing protein [Sulfuriferula sp.]|nr:Hpt domain-containing protein [Sulfuriferula sp.]
MTSSISDTLAELRRQFTDQLSGRIDALHTHAQRLETAAWQPADAEALHRLVQRLTSSAGIFGMQSVSDAARALETSLASLLKTGTAPTEAEWQTIGAALDRLNQLVRTDAQT